MSDGQPHDQGSHKPAKSQAAFRTISEVATDLDLPQHVLRFWETKFPQVRPMKRGGGRRYYRPDDVQLLVRIRDLLYIDGYTIKGVQKLLRQSGSVRNFVNETEPRVPLGSGSLSGEDTAVTPPGAASGHAPHDDSAMLADTDMRQQLREIVAELSMLRDQLLDSAA